jgi:aminopeptidase N
VGDEKFFKILQNYLTSNLAYNSAITEDFQKVAEETTGLKLEYFFQQWIYGESYPRYTYSWDTSEISEKLKVTVTQFKNTVPEYFSMPVEFKIVMQDGSSSTATFLIDKATQDIEISKAKGKISQVIFDPENKFLREVTELKTTSAITAIEPENDIVEWIISPNPADNRDAEPQVVVKFSIKQNANISVNIYDKLGRKLKELPTENLISGTYSKNISLSELSSGTYLVRLGIDDKYFGKTLVIK